MRVSAKTHQVQNTNFNVATQYNGGRPATLLSLSPLLVAYYIGHHMAAAAGAAAVAALLTRAAATLRLTRGRRMGELVRITGCWTTRKVWAICPPTHYNTTGLRACKEGIDDYRQLYVRR